MLVPSRIPPASRKGVTWRWLGWTLPLTLWWGTNTWGQTTPRPIVIQFSHVVAADTPKGRAALRFKELAEARTDGRVQVEVYPNSQLYQDREELEALRLGAVQMLAPSLSKLAVTGISDFEVFDLPFLFRSHADFHAIANGPIGAALLHKLDAQGFKGLAYWDNGFKVFSANRPLRRVEDFQGLKFRVQASRTLVAQMKALQAEPSVSTFVNVHDALRSGKLDGQENTPVNIISQHLNEVQTHLTLSNHGYLAYAVLVNQAFWDHLPAPIRTVLEGALRDATAFENGLAETENAKALERIQNAGNMIIYRPNPAELRAWARTMNAAYAQSQAWIDPQMMAAVQAQLHRTPEK